MNIIQQLEQEQLRSDIPDFRAGDTVRVHARVSEKDCIYSPFFI